MAAEPAGRSLNHAIVSVLGDDLFRVDVARSSSVRWRRESVDAAPLEDGEEPPAPTLIDLDVAEISPLIEVGSRVQVEMERWRYSATVVGFQRTLFGAEPYTLTLRVARR